MTVDEFFEQLPKDGWYLRDGIALRRDAPPDWETPACCPITSLSECDIPTTRFFDVAKKIGLHRDDALRIANAADGQNLCDRGLRQRLLAHCGITKPAA